MLLILVKENFRALVSTQHIVPCIQPKKHNRLPAEVS
uniref:Uncharacterized protein n=1 Tax=Arundo donax TaxID=35708 RepID=A0A0A9A557_ARUDO